MTNIRAAIEFLFAVVASGLRGLRRVIKPGGAWQWTILFRRLETPRY